MQVKVLKRSKNELKIQIDEEGHTFCNVIQKALLEDKRVEMAGYNIPHPLTKSAVLYISTKARSKPEVVLRAAVKEVQKNTKDFKLSFNDALKSFH
ncbi:MAG: DNA-directed RNA polymerase subunit L [Candidatus Bathyarchaeota archaeon]|nr:DNA-directed RNA polymerase subunit L [Candidatus Bathyarchaeota archaeon]